ncbi:hypothetical protein A3Q56_03529 [Intoshia linei]|uniref:Ubiquitin carboxyl-terminal hydrolase n=1 Tax=Intoshia linei TaxID=1819745 RepID=A0A177B3B8_9BILA|nr:hypothetical protein A3Q56_03529 [Intoshia linei]
MIETGEENLLSIDDIESNPIENEKDDIKRIINTTKLQTGAKWYIIYKQWLDAWKGHVNYCENCEEIEDIDMPSPICNSNLLNEDKTLKQDIGETIEFEFIPAKAWNFFLEKYGLDCVDKNIFERRVVWYKDTDETLIEMSKLNLKILIFNSQLFPKIDAKMIEIDGKKHFEIEMSLFPSCTVNHFKSLIESRVPSCNQKKLELKCENLNHTMKKFNIFKSENVHDQMHKYMYLSNAELELDIFKESEDIVFKEFDKNYTQCINGKCGLSNIGNTCYMNAALQCVSKIKPLVNYFTKENWRRHLNFSAKDGTRTELAHAFGEFINAFWVDSNAVFTPSKIKKIVSKFDITFRGFGQNDSQEFLLSLLSFLHEDLNKAQKTPYDDIDNDLDEEEIARLSYENYKERNDSIITDLFYGQLRTQVTCNVCGWKSITFDMFSSLSVPIPNYKTITAMYSSFKAIESKRITLNINSDDYVYNIKEKVAVQMKTKPENLEIYNKTPRIKMYGNCDKINFENPVGICIYIYEKKSDYSTIILKVLYNDENENESFLVPECIFSIEKGIYTVDSIFESILSSVSIVKRFFDLNDTQKPIYNNKICRLSFSEPPNTELDESRNYIESNYVLLNLYCNETFVALYKELDIDLDLDSEKELFKNSKCHKDLNIDDCFKLYNQTQCLQGKNAWKCERCKKSVDAFINYSIKKLPKILIIQLKRFRMTRHYRRKIDTKINFPLRNLNMTPYMNNKIDAPKYNLISIVNHMGGLTSGHYTAYAKIDKNWFYFNDSSVSECSESNIRKSMAYVFIYERVD